MKRLKSRGRTLVTIITIIIIFFVGFVYIRSAINDIAVHSKILHTLEQSKIANHDLNENILRLKTFMLQSYDPLVRDVAKQLDICKSLNNDAIFESLRLKQTMPLLTDYCKSLKGKADLIERYKTLHSVLRNSMKYLPTIVKHFSSSRYSDSTHALFSNVILYNFERSEDLEDNIYKLLRRLPKKLSNKTDDEMMASLRLHVNLIVNYSVTRSVLEEKILSSLVIVKLEHLVNQYLDWYQVRQNRGISYHFFLVFVCFALGLWLVLIFKRLQAVSDDLHDLNVNLEDKVAERTRELSEAMKKLENSQTILAQSAKMTALGEMAGGIAHEINTPLSAILMNAEMLLDKIDQATPELVRKRTEAIIKIVARVSKIIMGLKRFSRNSDVVEKSRVSVQTIVDDTLTLCNEKFKSQSVNLEIRLDASDLTVHCVPEHISQVLLNFLNNSLYALKDKESIENKWVSIQASKKDDQVEISVTDAGTGLPEAVQAKLMQPFFTTKPPGVGTGLGLSISKGIVEQSGGEMYYDKKCPNTRFVLRLPA